MADQEPEAVEAQEVDPGQLDDAELEKLVDETEDPLGIEPQEAPGEFAEEVEPQEMPGSEPVAADAAAESEPEEEPEQVPSELDEVRARLEVAEKRAKHFESVAGGHAGKVGFLEQQMQQLRERVAQQQAQPPVSDPYAEPQPQLQQPVPQMPQQPDQNAQFMAQQAKTLVAQEFLNSHPDSVVKDEATGAQSMDPIFAAELAKHTVELQRLETIYDPMQIQSEMRRILSDAYGRTDTVRAELRAQDVAQKRVDSAASLKAKKRAAAVSTDAGSGSPSVPRGRPRDPSQMSNEDLVKVIRSMES